MNRVSERWTLSAYDWRKILRDGLIALAGFVITWAIEALVPDLEKNGVITAAVAAIVISLLSALRRFVSDTRGLVVLLALSLAAIGSGATAADIQAPNRADVYSLVRASTPATGTGYAWFVMGPQGFAESQTVDGGRQVVFTGPPGRYAVLLVVSGEGGKLDQGQAFVVIGDPPPPTPPPGPQPPTPPVPPAPTPGKRTLTIIRESHDQSANFASVVRDLRSGQAEKYLREKGHQLYVLDPDQRGPDGQPTNLLKQWEAIIAGMTRPVLVISDSGSRNVLHKQSLPADLGDAQTILEALKNAGGG